MSEPRSGETRVKTARVPDDLWNAALKKAQKNGETITAVIIRALERYLETGE